MMWFGYGSGLMGIWMVLFWAGVVLLVVWGVRAMSAPRDRDERAAEAILADRFARGEIDQSEFEQRRRALERS